VQRLVVEETTMTTPKDVKEALEEIVGSTDRRRRVSRNLVDIVGAAPRDDFGTACFTRSSRPPTHLPGPIGTL
jgi:hypothetical protein